MQEKISKAFLKEEHLSYAPDKQGRLRLRPRRGVPAARIREDPAFERTRKQGAEFGNAIRMSGRLRNAFDTTGRSIGGPHLTARLVSPLVKVIQGDTRHPLGERCVADGDLGQLAGFEFNEYHCPPALSGLRCSLLWSRQGDRVLLQTDAFAASVLRTPQVQHATHFRVSLLIGVIPGELEKQSTLYKESTDSMVMAHDIVPALRAAVDLQPDQKPVLYCVALSVSFYQFRGSLSIPFKSGKLDLLRVLMAFSA
ncbi:MAG TPA: hypothetical protein VLD19_11895 [Chitinophagaceae bacterium]|nr:hypothetical protein [Chitinophagaceae bacterium]